MTTPGTADKAFVARVVIAAYPFAELTGVIGVHEADRGTVDRRNCNKDKQYLALREINVIGMCNMIVQRLSEVRHFCNVSL